VGPLTRTDVSAAPGGGVGGGAWLGAALGCDGVFPHALNISQTGIPIRSRVVRMRHSTRFVAKIRPGSHVIFRRLIVMWLKMRRPPT
jgi:hypothetical protein